MTNLNLQETMVDLKLKFEQNPGYAKGLNNQGWVLGVFYRVFVCDGDLIYQDFAWWNECGDRFAMRNELIRKNKTRQLAG
jgi:hypothetical protein